MAQPWADRTSRPSRLRCSKALLEESAFESLSLRLSQRRTDLSWPKNTVNILGSVLRSLMVQDANTPKPTSYTQSLAPKEILCLHHMKSWICIQSRGEEQRERKDVGDGKKKSPNVPSPACFTGTAASEQNPVRPRRVWRPLGRPPNPPLTLERGYGRSNIFTVFSSKLPPGHCSRSCCRFRSPRPGLVPVAHSPSLSAASWWLRVELDSSKSIFAC